MTHPLNDAMSAHFYETMDHSPDHAFVKVSYAAFRDVVMHQWHHLREGGITFIAMDENPYPDSKAMMVDVRQNLQLKVWCNGGDHMDDDHPMKQKVESGVDGFVVLNDVFRGVHDIMGHVYANSNFGPTGEDLAWKAHRETMPAIAHSALWCETKGQNAWTNFTPAHRHLKLVERPFPTQKSGFIPPFLASA